MKTVYFPYFITDDIFSDSYLKSEEINDSKKRAKNLLWERMQENIKLNSRWQSQSIKITF